MASDNDASEFMVIPRRKSSRLNPSITSTATTGPPPPPCREPAATLLATQREESHNQQPPFQPDSHAHTTKKSKAKSSTMPNRRRSARLNPRVQGSLTMPEAQAHNPKPAKTSSTSGGAKLYFGPNPSWPEGNEGLKKKIKTCKPPGDTHQSHEGVSAQSLPLKSSTILEGADTSPTSAEAHCPATGPVLGGGDASGPDSTPPGDAGASGPILGGGEASGTARSPTHAEDSGPVLGSSHASGPELTPTRASPSGAATSTGPGLSTARVEASGSAEESQLWPSWEDIDTAVEDWDKWETKGQTATPDSTDPHAGDPHIHHYSSDNASESGQLLLDDDGNRRCRLRRPLHSCPEAFTACGQELEESVAAGKGKGKRKRNKGKLDVRAGRGLGKPRDPTRLEDRPELRVVADRVFATTPDDTKYITTIRILALENMPGPYRSWNFFPTRTRLAILKQFLQRYS